MPFTRPVAGMQVTVEDFGQPVYDSIIASGRFTAVTLSFQNLTVSSQQSWVRRTGYACDLRCRLVLATLSPSPRLILPYLPSSTHGVRPIAYGSILQNGVRWWTASGIADIGTGTLDIMTIAGDFMTPTFPFTWKAGDEIHLSVQYVTNVSA